MNREQIEQQLRADNPTTTDDAGGRHGPGSTVYEAAIQRWADAMEAQLAESPPDRKTWPSAAAFLGEFSMPELAAIELSTNPIIAALRLVLAAWTADVWSDDERILIGMGALVDAGILAQERAAAILQP
jgi:hypothetical protein